VKLRANSINTPELTTTSGQSPYAADEPPAYASNPGVCKLNLPGAVIAPARPAPGAVVRNSASTRTRRAGRRTALGNRGEHRCGV